MANTSKPKFSNAKMQEMYEVAVSRSATNSSRRGDSAICIGGFALACVVNVCWRGKNRVGGHLVRWTFMGKGRSAKFIAGHIDEAEARGQSEPKVL